MVESTPPNINATSPNLSTPSIEGFLENPIPPYQKCYKLTPLSIFRHIIYWSFAALILFLTSKANNNNNNEASAFTFVAVLIFFVLFNFGCWITSRFYDISIKCNDPKLLSQAEMDNIERELSDVKDRLNQAKDVFNAAETPEAQEEARNRMTELYVAKQTLSKTFSQQAIIRPKLMFLIIYGIPYVKIGADLEANEVLSGHNNPAAPLIEVQSPTTSFQTVPLSSSSTNNQAVANVEEENHGSTAALFPKRNDSNNSDSAVF